MTRRAWLLSCAAAFGQQEDRQEFVDFFGLLAARLSQEGIEDFLKAFSKKFAERERLTSDVRALALVAEVASSVEVLSVNGEGDSREVRLDWFLELRPRSESGELRRRKETLTVKLARRKRNWEIVELQPVAFFSPSETK